MNPDFDSKNIRLFDSTVNADTVSVRDQSMKFKSLKVDRGLSLGKKTLDDNLEASQIRKNSYNLQQIDGQKDYSFVNYTQGHMKGSVTESKNEESTVYHSMIDIAEMSKRNSR